MKSECIIQPTTPKCWCFFNILRPRCWLLCSQILGDLVSISWDWFQHLAASEAKLMTDWKCLRWLKAHCAMHFWMMEVLGGKSFKQAGSDENLLSQERRFEVWGEKSKAYGFSSSGSSTLLCHLDVADEHGCIRQNGGLHQKHCILNFTLTLNPGLSWNHPWTYLAVSHPSYFIIFSKINCLLVMLCSCWLKARQNSSESQPQFITLTINRLIDINLL